MRFAFDGLPRDLPLTPPQRRELVERVRAWRPPEGLLRQAWIALLPGAVLLGGMALWMPALWKLPTPWNLSVAAAVLVVQPVLMFWLLPRALWRHRWRALHACGYPVCYRCAYPRRDTDHPQCPECGFPQPSAST